MAHAKDLKLNSMSTQPLWLDSCSDCPKYLVAEGSRNLAWHISWRSQSVRSQSKKESVCWGPKNWQLVLTGPAAEGPGALHAGKWIRERGQLAKYAGMMVIGPSVPLAVWLYAWIGHCMAL